MRDGSGSPRPGGVDGRPQQVRDTQIHHAERAGI